jgi:hypothetical protein
MTWWSVIMMSITEVKEEMKLLSLDVKTCEWREKGDESDESDESDYGDWAFMVEQWIGTMMIIPSPPPSCGGWSLTRFPTTPTPNHRHLGNWPHSDRLT